MAEMARTLFMLAGLAALALIAGCADTRPVVPETRMTAPPSPLTAARSHIGAPYRSGGNSPETGFDCSGLVQWSYALHGVKLPRRTEDMLHAGRPVAKDDLIPGDLVFFKVSSKRWGLHVGLYSGRGYFIHSPTPGAKVREESLSLPYWARAYLGARRVLKPPPPK
jgi:cell wall-associated NlpC family hydrolase